MDLDLLSSIFWTGGDSPRRDRSFAAINSLNVFLNFDQ